MSAPLLLGHRGDPTRHAENTIQGFAAALACGADGVELDVQVSRDGVPVVIHDATLDRTTGGSGPVSRHTWQELEALGVPALASVLDALHDHAVAVEIKPPHATHPQLAADVLQIARNTSAARVMILSFDHAHLSAARHADAQAQCVALTRERPRDPLALLDTCGAQTLALWWQHVDTALCDRLRDAGRRIIAWTVDTADDAVALARMGVDGIIADTPCAVARRLRDLEARPPAGA